MQIKNIVFDVGGVILENHSLDFFKKNLTYKEDAIEVNNIWFNSIERMNLDKGFGEIEDLYQSMINKLPLRSKEEGIKYYKEYWNNRITTSGMVEFFDLLKTKGYNLYVLSNFQKDFNEMIKINNMGYLNKFDGIYVSSLHNLVKPDKEIYEDFLKEYKLTSGECLFIDDKQENVDAAISVGYQGALFENINNLKNKLEGMNII